MIKEIYISGIITSSVMGIMDEARFSHYYNNTDFAVNCFKRAILEGFVGLWWPLTVVGKLIDNTIKKQEILYKLYV